MPVWNTYAYILDGTIRDLISYKFDESFQANYCAKALLGENAIAVDVTYIPVNIDTDFYDYDTQSFYRLDENNNRIYLERSLNPIETVNLLQSTVENLMNQVDHIAITMIDSFEGNNENAENNMVLIYAGLIRRKSYSPTTAQEYTIDDVPIQYREKVRQELNS